MKVRPFRGFTLVELLVVITVIGTLMGMLLPAVNYFLEVSRRNTCSGNEHNVSLALISFAESDRKGFPGYINRVGADSKSWMEASWVVMLLPQLERADLWEIWRQGTAYDASASTAQSNQGSDNNNNSNKDDTSNKNTNPRKRMLKILICPSSPPDQAGPNDAPLSYVVNAGYLGGTTVLPSNAVRQAFGVCFFNGLKQGQPFEEARVTSDYISLNDGTSNTLLVAENVNAGQWANDTPIWEEGDHGQSKLGFVWHASADKLVNHVNRDYRMNDDKYREEVHARPSSRHSGGAMVAFCDGHAHFLKEDVEPRVYWHLMTPNGKAARIDGLLPKGIPDPPLSDSEY